MGVEIDPLVENTVHKVVTEAEEVTIITTVIMVAIIGPGIAVMGTIKGMIDIIVGLITEGIVSIKIMVKDIETEV